MWILRKENDKNELLIQQYKSFEREMYGSQGSILKEDNNFEILCTMKRQLESEVKVILNHSYSDIKRGTMKRRLRNDLESDAKRFCSASSHVDNEGSVCSSSSVTSGSDWSDDIELVVSNSSDKSSPIKTPTNGPNMELHDIAGDIKRGTMKRRLRNDLESDAKRFCSASSHVDSEGSVCSSSSVTSGSNWSDDIELIVSNSSDKSSPIKTPTTGPNTELQDIADMDSLIHENVLDINVNYDSESDSEGSICSNSSINSSNQSLDTIISDISETRTDIEILRANNFNVDLPDISEIIPNNIRSPKTSSILDTSRNDDPDYEPVSSDSVQKTTTIDFEKSYNSGDIEPPMYTNLQILTSENKVNKKRRYLSHLCKYCRKDQKNLKRHLSRMHANEPEVQEMIKATSNKRKNRSPMKKLLFAGDFMYNTNKNLNQGLFRVARACRTSKCASDFTACPNCKGMYIEKEFRTHFRKCSGINSKNTRNIASLGRQMVPNFSHNASKELRKNILSKMRNDKVLRVIRYDNLIIEYGNQLCCHLRGPENKTNICTQLRRLGRLKLTLGEKKMKNIFLPAKCLGIINAIINMSNGGIPLEETNFCLRYPTLTQNLYTLVKALANTYRLACIRNNELTIKATIDNFLDLFTGDYKDRLSRTAATSHNEHRRHKTCNLPIKEDIKKLYDYLQAKRQFFYNQLVTNTFSENIYLNLLKVTLTSLQVYNRRRPGDIERISIEDFKNIQTLENTDNGINNNFKDLAKEFSVLYARGKLGREIKILVSQDIRLCMEKLVDLRDKIDIGDKNHYLFALPQTVLYSIRHPSAYILLRKFAQDCGAEQPFLLTATKLRKQLATACIELNLNDAELNDLASYMGHHINIHKSYYRRNIITRDVPMFLKFLGTALGETEDFFYNAKENLDLSGEPQNISDSLENHNEDTMENTNENVENYSGNSYRSQKSNDSKRIRYTAIEKTILQERFSSYLEGRSVKAPSSNEIRNILNNHGNIFQNRNVNSIKTWLFLQKNK